MILKIYFFASPKESLGREVPKVRKGNFEIEEKNYQPISRILSGTIIYLVQALLSGSFCLPSSLSDS